MSGLRLRFSGTTAGNVNYRRRGRIARGLVTAATVVFIGVLAAGCGQTTTRDAAADDSSQTAATDGAGNPNNCSYSNLVPSAVLNGCNFAKANLTGVNLTGAQLISTNFGGANLTDANLSHANVSGTNFLNATLAGTNFTGATFSPDTTCPSGHKATTIFNCG